MMDITGDFPLLTNYNRMGHLVYADSAATTQKPSCVLDALTEWYTVRNANPHRGSYKLGSLATDIYEYARETVADHIHADKREVVFCRNTTEAINLVAWSFAESLLKEGEEILLTIAEHHSNLIPWQELARRKKCKLVYLLTDKQGRILEQDLENKINDRTRIVAVAMVSNVLGTRFPVEEIAARAHQKGAFVIADCAQGFLHYGLDVSKLGVDFAAFSGHKAFGPDGIGVLWGKYELLEKMPPLFMGGEMVDKVSWRESTWLKPPLRFEAGTQNASGAFAFAVAIRYINEIGQQNICDWEAYLTRRLLAGMKGIPRLRIYGNPDYAEDRNGIVSFNFIGQSPLLVGRYFDSQGINIRSGTHCAQPLLAYLGVSGTCRISLAPYNTEEDIDCILEALRGGPEMVVRTVLRRVK